MLLRRPVMSLRDGLQAAITQEAICNPNNLKIEGFFCQDSKNHKSVVLVEQDIRDIIPQGIIINDREVLTDPKELVRLKKTIDLHFGLIGKQVETISKSKVGKVNDFATETTTMYIQKLYVSQSLLKNLTGGSLAVDRNQIVEITDKKIIIQDLDAKAPATARAMA